MICVRPGPSRTTACLLVGALLLPGAGCGASRRMVVGTQARGVSFRITGERGPLIVLESGLGRGQDVWDALVPMLAEHARVLTYDRAGLGRSDPGPRPRSAGRAAEELHALLEARGERGPLILVGHSYGGMVARLYAARHPERVRSLVLVDATHEDYPAIEAALEGRRRASKRETELGMAPRAARDERDALPQSAAELRAALLPRSLPLLVLSAGARRGPPELEREWERLQVALTGLSSEGRRVVIEGAGHELTFEAPEAIAEAILDLIERP